VSIAFEVEGKIVFGLVYDPIRRERFIAEKGRGSRLNGRLIRVSKSSNLRKSLLVTGFAYDLRKTLSGNLKHFKNLLTRSRGIRRTGSAALDLCYVASGRFDGFWEMQLNPWDTAAGKLIVEEAGGRVSDFSGGSFSVTLREILATNGRIHREMIRWLSSRPEKRK
ncbi:MAG TPA: inositol monophosphatase family protein, partial [Nitrospiria bacterium]|nr:inositol monophosphatase family protein [Nitrospiria bacterium]